MVLKNLSAADCARLPDGPLTRIGALHSAATSMVRGKNETAAANRGGASPGSRKGPRVGSEIFLREDDLYAPVLRLAHARCCWHARIVHAATGYDHVGACHTEGGQCVGYGIRPPLGEPLVVAGRA
jgi:hypothetical protein